MRRIVTIGLALVVLSCQTPTASAIALGWPAAVCGPEADRESTAKFDGDDLNLHATSTDVGAGCGAPAAGGTPSGPPTTLITSTDACVPTTIYGSSGIAAACVGQAGLDLQNCDPDLGFDVSPTSIQTLQPDGTYSEPRLNSVLVCNQAPGAAPVVVTQADFRTLPLTPSAIVVGPSQGWVPVNMITVVYTDPQPQVLTTTLLGQPVTVSATPRDYAWDWADGSTPTTTTDPGAPWPDHTVSHTYPWTGEYTVTMTTTWTGEYSLDGGTTYTPITGTATTTSTAPPLTVTELRSHLVEDPLS